MILTAMAWIFRSSESRSLDGEQRCGGGSFSVACRFVEKMPLLHGGARARPRAEAMRGVLYSLVLQQGMSESGMAAA